MANSRRPRRTPPAEVVKLVPEAPKRSWWASVTDTVLQRARRAPIRVNVAPPVNPFAPAEHPPGVAPARGMRLAMDDVSGLSNNVAWAQQASINGAINNGYTFLGYSVLSELAQVPEYRVISEVIAEEATREWIEFEIAGGDESKNEKLKLLTDYVEKYHLKAVCQEACLHDGFFGRSHVYVDTGATDDRDELKTSIGNGRDGTSKLKVRPKRGAVQAFRNVEPIWCYPTQYDSADPLKWDWYHPNTWFVMGKEVHHTRLLTFIAREVPDLLKPAYSFGGLSLSQMAKPYVDNFLRTRQSVSDIIRQFSVMVLGSNLAETLQQGGDALFARVDLFNLLRDNRGTMVIDKDTEEFSNVSAPLGSLDALQAQTQEHMSAVSRIPLVKLLGITPSGLNATSEGEIRVFYDTIAAYQEAFLRPNLTSMIDLIQLSEFGEVDQDITFKFKPLWQLDEAAQAAVDKTKADIHDTYIAMGAVSAEEVREALANDQTSPYDGIDLSQPLPEPMSMPGEEFDPTQPEPGEGGAPNAKDPDLETVLSPGGELHPRDIRDRSEGVAARAGNLPNEGTGGFSGGAGDGV